MNSILSTEALFDLSHTAAAPLLEGTLYPWEVLPEIGNFLLKLIERLPREEYIEHAENVWIHKSVNIPKSAVITGPTVIFEGTEIRPGSFLRGNVLVGEGCVIGNSTEVKNAILFDGVQLPHYNYVGDSVLGYKAHLGAGAILSNFRLDKGTVSVHAEEKIPTGLRKFGGIVGDYSEIGCNSVVFPGTVIGRECIIYPLSRVRGVVRSRTIYKSAGDTVPRK